MTMLEVDMRKNVFCEVRAFADSVDTHTLGPKMT